MGCPVLGSPDDHTVGALLLWGPWVREGGQMGSGLSARLPHDPAPGRVTPRTLGLDLVTAPYSHDLKSGGPTATGRFLRALTRPLRPVASGGKTHRNP